MVCGRRRWFSRRSSAIRTDRIFTCDAGHKAVSADAGVPTGAVVGHTDWKPGKPSEEHLPIEIPEGVSSAGNR
jgi:hypothetical protein